MRETSFGRFQDFPPGGKFLGGGWNLLTRHGLAHGKAFLDWFDEKLNQAPFSCTKTADGQNYRLKLIACDVTNRQLLVLPDDLPLYREPGEANPIDPDTFPIARAARMSMSIPYFFEPVTLIRVETGKKATIVDGGTLSNFPVWIFDVDQTTPRRPTFGFTLTGGRGFGGQLVAAQRLMPWPLRFGFDIFHTAQEAWDTRFVSHSTRVRTLAVDAGDVGTTEFDLSREKQEMLVANGIRAATAFLDQFDLGAYMNTFHRKLEPDPEPVAV
jgi:NTE family protein